MQLVILLTIGGFEKHLWFPIDGEEMCEGRYHSCLGRGCLCHHSVTMSKHLNDIKVKEKKVFHRVLVSELWAHGHDVAGSTQTNKTAYLLAARNQSKQE